MNKLIVFVLCVLVGCASSKVDHKWYEVPGIAFGGATIGAVIGPENVAIRESHARSKPNEDSAWYSVWGSKSETYVGYHIFGTVCHIGTTITLAIIAPPFAWGYIGVSALVGASQFGDHGAWDEP